MTVSFIVPALNEERHIGRCLDSIRGLQLPENVQGVEIIVVDNRSTDRTAEISRAGGAIVEDVVPGRPSCARNAGVRRSKGEWLAFIDADCELPSNWLTVCGAHLLGDEKVVAAAGVMQGPAGNASWVERSWYEIGHRSGTTSVRNVRWLPTFNLLVKRDAFDAAGGFDESLATCEDCDLGYRLEKLGTLVVDPRAQVVHRGESRSLGELFRREAWRTRGNVQLALMRPFDGPNWLSLLFPPGAILGLFVALCGLVVAILAGWQSWPWIVAVTLCLGVILILLFRKTVTANPLSLLKHLLVFAAYLGGRTAGLFWSFQRVER